jgi:DNA-binding GntR family transcriptional regulator
MCEVRHIQAAASCGGPTERHEMSALHGATGQGEDTGLSQLTRTSLRDGAARQIRAQIISGSLLPGELYSIGNIAAQLGVSVTPVREALLDLAKEELVELVRNRGFRIRTVGDDDLDAIVDLRVMIEVATIRGLAEARPPHDLSELRAVAEETERYAAAGDMVAFIARDHELHMALLALAGNRYVVETVEQLRNQTRLYGLQQIGGTPDLVDSAREHARLIDAIERAAAEEAGRMMAQHIRHARGLWAGAGEGS